MKVIKSERFVLRPYKKEDKHALVKYLNNKNIVQGTRTIPHPYTIEHAKEVIKRNMTEDTKGNKSMINFVIEHNGELIGAIGIGKLEGHAAKIGYWIAEPFWGRGFMTEALLLFSRYAFRELKVRRLYAHVIDFNKGSQRVLEKAGFTLEGIMKKHYKIGAKYYDGYLYSRVN